MGTKLYVGNLPWSLREDELKLSFSQCGHVREAKIIADRETGRSRGFGFVTMGTEDEARAAIERWNGSQLGGRELVVNEATEKPRSSGGGGGQPRRDFGPPPDGGRGGGSSGRKGRGRGRDRDYDDYR